MKQFEINEEVFFHVNPLHMEIVDNDPVIDGKIIEIEETITTREMNREFSVRYKVECGFFDHWVSSVDIYKTYEEAAVEAREFIVTLLNKRSLTNTKLKKAMKDIG